MFLQKLDIQGFKSFANKTVLEFPNASKKGKGITAIVGPNGSGKSNIADAIRWVLGEQSVKMLRGKKSEDVIFSGSDKKSRLGLAEVSLYFNNNDRAIPIDYPEVVITRRLYRDGESEYLINKAKTRLQDIVLLLAKANLAQRTYCVIGQGMVDSILSATLQERKEFFDEAAGVLQYRIKRDQALSKFKATLENLVQTDLMIQEIEPRVRSLGRQVKRLEKREEAEKELKAAQRQYYGRLWEDLGVKTKNQTLRLHGVKKNKEIKENSLRNIVNNLAVAEKKTQRTEIFNQLQAEYEKIYEQKNSLREKEIILKNKLEMSRRIEIEESRPITNFDIINKLERFLERQDHLVAVMSGVVSPDDLKKIKDQFTALNKEFRDFIGAVKNPTLAAKKIIHEDPTLQKELVEILNEMAKIVDVLKEVQNKIANFNQEEEKKNKELFDLQREFQSVQQEVNELARQYNEINIELARFETRQEDLENEINRELGNIEALSDERGEEVPELEAISKIQQLKHQMELIGGIDPETIKEYEETKTRYDFLSSQAKDLEEAIKSLEKAIEQLDEAIKKQFNEAFKQINYEFEQYFKILFSGGKASLVKVAISPEVKGENGDGDEGIEAGILMVEQKPEAGILKEAENFSKRLREREKENYSGIEIHATPPGKRLKNINMLSGGERALTSIALICAIISNNPSPFVVLDEVDAALDESNSIRFAEILDRLSDKTQFIAITHNRATMQKAILLYGVTMGDDGVSKLLSIDLAEAEKAVGNS
jgi:chromosome segregation protein